MKVRFLATGSAGNCALFFENEKAIVIDCGVKFQELALYVKPSQIEAVLLTHSHGDHAAYAKAYAKFGLPIYCTQGTADAVGLFGPTIHIIEPTKTYTLPTFQFLAFEVMHNAKGGTVGFRFGTEMSGEAIFATDLAGVGYKIPDVEYIFIEGNYCENIVMQNGTDYEIHHLSIQQAAKLINEQPRQNLQNLFIIHTSDRNAPKEESEILEHFQVFCPKYEAKKGLVVGLHLLPF